MSQEIVKKAVYSLATSKLASYRSDYKLPTPVKPSTMDDIATKIPNGCPRQSLENPIKGLFFTNQGNAPSIFLAFHDLRDAIAAKSYFDSRESDALDECVGEGKDETGKRNLVCKFQTMEQVTNVREINCSLFAYRSPRHALVETGTFSFSQVNGPLIRCYS